MKKVKFALIFVLLCGFLVAGQTVVQASTIWEPTNENVNYILFGPASIYFALFDDQDTSHTNPLYLFGGPTSLPSLTVNTDAVSFSQTGGNWTALNSPSSITLGSTNYFKIAATDGLSGWVDDTGVTNYNNNIFEIAFGSFGNLDFQIDAQPVPIPASAFLLGAGLIGLIGFRRRVAKG